MKQCLNCIGECWAVNIQFLIVQNYFEELVSVRDNQLARANADFTALSDEKEREKKELEDVVLELQRQL